ncbi:MAG TPA: energy transducer TonB [Sphingomicrobium sp.]|jgi:protein TonB|nr:energy transducer TonB [Sphingomicrobium sp.]
MLAYAASRPRIGARQSSPNALLFVILAHIVVIALVMSAKMALPPTVFDPPTRIIRVTLTPEPPPPTPPTRSTPNRDSHARDVHRVEGPSLPGPRLPLDLGEASEPVMTGDSGTVSIRPLPPVPIPLPISSRAQLLTPPSDLKPPYPPSKLLTGEEASLTLRLTVDDDGRVVAVEPIGRADPVFLAAARRHLLGHWRYKPAIEDGRAISSSVVVTLRFELDG